jgi:hypothetical protein
MEIDVALMSSQDADEAGAQAFGLMYLGPGLYSIGFGFIACGNCAGGIGFDRDNRYRFAAQLGS